jgi:hypothetical protein
MQSYLTCFAIIIPLALIFASCSYKADKEKMLLSNLSVNRERIDHLVDRMANRHSYSLEDKLYNPWSKEKAGIWLPIAKKVSKISENALEYLDSLESSIRESERSSTEIFDGGQNEKKLYARLIGYRENLLHSESIINEQLSNWLILINNHYDSLLMTGNFKARDFLGSIDGQKTVAFIQMIKINFKLNEETCLALCDEQVPKNFDGFTVYAPIIGQNSSYLKPGENLEITAFISFVAEVIRPKIWINRKLIKLSDDGAAHYSTNNTNLPGKYSIPIRIEFTNADNKRDTVLRMIKYEVAKPCGE